MDSHAHLQPTHYASNQVHKIICVGAAARRGLDDLGHVVFYHVPMFKVSRLLSAPLPRLRGQFLMTPTLVLRTALLHQQLQLQRRNRGGSKAAQQQQVSPLQGAAHLLGCIVQRPFMQPTNAAAAAAAAGGPAGAYSQALLPTTGTGSSGRSAPCDGKKQDTAMAPMQQALLHSFAMAVRHLLDCHLLSAHGHAMGLAGLATHIFWTQPANLAFVRLLTSGALHDMLQEARTRVGAREVDHFEVVVLKLKCCVCYS